MIHHCDGIRTRSAGGRQSRLGFEPGPRANRTIDRRLVLASLGSAGIAPTNILAQPARRLPRVGLLLVGTTSADMAGPEPRNPFIRAFVDGMRELGLVHGQHFVTEPRGEAGQPERHPAIVAELVATQPDVIVSAGPFLPHLQRATSTIPIVMSAADDPVAQGFIESFARPGTNFTGRSHQSLDIIGKRLELLRELISGVGKIAVLWDQEFSASSWQMAEEIGRVRGWPLHSVEVKPGEPIESAFKAAADAQAGALLVFAPGRLFAFQREVAELAARYRLPAMYHLRPYVDAGGFASYAANLAETWRRAATFVDRILKGAKPADLPVEQPTRLELVINLKTARALGLTLPPYILTIADEVIE